MLGLRREQFEVCSQELHKDSWKRRQEDPPKVCSEEKGLGRVVDNALSPWVSDKPTLASLE
jgi:hypothetical protein